MEKAFQGGIDVKGNVTNEQYNCFRLQMARYKIMEKLRNRFHEKFSRDPATLYKQLLEHKNMFVQLKKKRTINQIQFDLIFHKTEQTSTLKLDEHTLTILIIYLYKLPKPKKSGWFQEPKPNDVSESATLTRFRIGRNLIQHLPVSLPDDKFRTTFEYIKKPMLDYGCWFVGNVRQR